MTTAIISSLADQLRRIVGNERILSAQSDLMVYECDGFVIEKNSPDVVVFPETTDEVAAIVNACVAADVPFLPRGAGTSLAGGCLPVGAGDQGCLAHSFGSHGGRNRPRRRKYIWWRHGTLNSHDPVLPGPAQRRGTTQKMIPLLVIIGYLVRLLRGWTVKKTHHT